MLGGKVGSGPTLEVTSQGLGRVGCSVCSGSHFAPLASITREGQNLDEGGGAGRSRAIAVRGITITHLA